MTAVAAAPRDRIDVPLTFTPGGSAATDLAPRGWALRTFVGRPDVAVVRTDGRTAIRLASERSSFVLHRDLVVDLADLPTLTWSWKVVRLPAGADARHAERDDQAAQLYVVFPRWPTPLTRSDVVGYVWDTTAPVGTTGPSTKAGNVRLVVVESGASRVGTWQRYQRNVADDYVALFGKKPPRVGRLALMIDADDTRSDAEAFVAGISFTAPR